jgi:putative DNA primase/helicase
MTAKTAPHSSKKIEPEKWLWPGRVPEGHLTLLGGETGAGKSLITADIIARVTTGAPWPDGVGQAPNGEVLVISEDPVASMQNPRLIAAGADLDKVRFWRGSFNIERDLGDLEADFVEHPNTKLVVLDPLQDFMTATTYHAVRDALRDLIERARKHKVAVVAMGHPPKGLPYPKDSFGGSRGIPTVARAFWFVTEDDATHLMLFVKCNCAGRNGNGMRFRVVVKTVPAQGDTPVEGLFVAWDEAPVEMSANDWCFSEKGRRNQAEPKRAKDIAMAFLEEFLSDGPKLADEVMQEASRRGVKRGTLQSARMALGLVIRKRPGEAHGPWVWSLPAEQSKPSEEEAEERNKAVEQPGSNIVSFAHYQKTKRSGGGGDYDGGDAA